jgi:hypothetical protein
MKTNGTVKALAAAAVLSTSLLTGCIVAPAPGYYRGAAVVTVAPPAAPVEVIGVAPTPGYIWFPGFYGWEGGVHVWHAGYWGPGRAGYYWAPHRWVAYGGGWRMEPGHWVHR